MTMKKPLLLKVYERLCAGWAKLNPEARDAVESFVKSQKCGDGYMNAGGRIDDYYTQFGKILEAVFSKWKLIKTPLRLTVKESMAEDNVYGTFFRFLEDEMRFARPANIDVDLPKVLTTNAACCILAMQYQTRQLCDSELVEWLKARQEDNGGFCASETAPIPDLLSTGVALFTLDLIGEKAIGASDFIEAHWLDNGGFAPSIFDDYSDVEYVFYGLLSI